MIRRTQETRPSATTLLRWYDKHARVMPWRAKKGESVNPYHELLSEFMLQQTQVITVIPYFKAFIKRWPRLQDLAAASLEEVRAAWSGLGYYRRAKFLHECVRAVVARHDGMIPEDETALRALPGIGPYTSAAIAAIAFNKKAVVVDGNVERVMARVFAVDEKLPAARKKIYQLVQQSLPRDRFGDYAQAIMELGATVCLPRKPLCTTCPWRKHCQAYAAGVMEDYPRKTATKKIPQKYTTVFVVINKKGQVLLRRRPDHSMLGGMWEFPSSPWQEALPRKTDMKHAPAVLHWRAVGKPVQHVFSHFRLQAGLRIGHTAAAFLPQDGEYRWMKWTKLSTLALPTLTRRIADAARPHFIKKTVNESNL